MIYIDDTVYFKRNSSHNSFVIYNFFFDFQANGICKNQRRETVEVPPNGALSNLNVLLKMQSLQAHTEEAEVSENFCFVCIVVNPMLLLIFVPPEFIVSRQKVHSKIQL